MINSLESYADIGRSVARATNVQDGDKAKFERDYFRRMRAFESADDKRLADKAYNDAYTAARNVPKVKAWT